MSQALGTVYKQREIVLVPFPYSDLSSVKRRPVLIISNDKYNEQYKDVLVCVITSKIYQDNYSVEISNEELEYGFLAEPSCIKAHKIFLVNKSLIIKKFSVLSKKCFFEVVHIINNLIKIESQQNIK